MTTVTLEAAQATLPDLIHTLSPGDEVAITEDNRTVARLIGPAAELPRPILGRGKGKLIILSDDDSHLEDFKKYMP